MVNLRDLPSVEILLQTETAQGFIAQYGRPLVLSSTRQELDTARAAYPVSQSVPEMGDLLANIAINLKQWTSPSLQPVINATGVVLHTNLGRAPLSRAAVQALLAAAEGYTNLEFDLTKGKRGSRLVHAEEILKRLTGAEAGLVVNNNAAALLLILTVLARRKAAVIARSQMVEIGGGFRVPDVMKQSGARLVEIGATNRVHITDYEQAIAENPVALVLRAHRSNFRIVGFTTEPALDEIVRTAHQAEIPVVDDLGSGALLATEKYGLGHEPTVYESLRAGADLVCFSGDKLLGGPQAGIILGRADLVSRLKKHPLARAIRADKLCLAALSATLLHYLKDEAEREIPIWRMISILPGALEQRACSWVQYLGQGEVIANQSTVGGGSLPDEMLPTFVLALSVRNPNRFVESLRRTSPAVIARVENGLVVLDPRTVLPEQEAALLSCVQKTLDNFR